MAEKTTGEMKTTLGVTGLTFNAMALIAPGAFLWLTFIAQAGEGNTSPSMWSGIVFALLLCLATAVSYAELSKLYPGTGSAYYFAEQSFLNHDKAWKWARLMKFIVGWGSHLYYWIYPGVMVAATGAFVGYVVGALWPNFMSASTPGPFFMMAVAIVFTLLVCYIAHRGVTASTGVNVAMNVIQISALLVFSVMAIGYRVGHPPGSVAWQWDATSSDAYSCQFQTDAQGNILRNAAQIPLCKMDAAGKPVAYVVSYPVHDSSGNFLSHPTAGSVIGIHNFGWMFVQATIAILILVGFESCTSLGGEAKNPKRDLPIAVITSLLVQGAFCYLFEYFAMNYSLSSGYTMQTATGSSAPLADMMVMVGDAVFGQGHGRTFMLIEAITVFLALIGTTLACINTGARVTYAMSKDQEVPENFGILHEKNLSPHKAIWTLAVVTIISGCIALITYFGDSTAVADSAIKALPHGFWSSAGFFSHATSASLPNSFTTITLASNFGTFLLYGLSCLVCMVAYHKHPNFSFIKHWLIPAFGIVANLVCMSFYLIGPFMGYGTKMEPYMALGIAACWAIYGGIYFSLNSKKTGKTTMVTVRTT